MTSLDATLGQHQWWRRLKGGNWYHYEVIDWDHWSMWMRTHKPTYRADMLGLIEGEMWG